MPRHQLTARQRRRRARLLAAAATLLLTCAAVVLVGCGGDGAHGDADSTADAGCGGACGVCAPATCPDATLRYEAVAPVFAASCAPCHDGSSNPDVVLTSRAGIEPWRAEITLALVECKMPQPGKGVTIATADAQRILDWLACGAP